MRRLRDWFKKFGKKEKDTSPLPNFTIDGSTDTFLATVQSIETEVRNGTTGYRLLLSVDGVGHAVPSYLLDIPSIQENTNVPFDKIKQGDVIKTYAISSTLERFVPCSILGGIERQPEGTSPKNPEGTPIELGYTSKTLPLKEISEDYVAKTVTPKSPDKSHP